MQRISPATRHLPRVSVMAWLVALASCSGTEGPSSGPGDVGGAAGSPLSGAGGRVAPGGGGGSVSIAGAAGTSGSGGAGGAQAGASAAGGAFSGDAGARATSGGAGQGGASGGGGGPSAAGDGGVAGASGVSGSSNAAGALGGGASGASGAGGAAGVAGVAGAGDPGCPPGGVLCDGFEGHASGSPPGGPWTPSTRGGGAIVVDTSRAFSGRHSLHVTGTLSAARANVSAPIETESAVLHVRFMMYTASYPASSGVHTRLARLGDATAANGAPDSAYALATYNGTAIEKVNSIYLRDTGTKLNDASLRDRWVCWEFGIDKSRGTGNVEVQLWRDGNQLSLSPAGSSSHGMTSPSWDPIPFDLFMLGLDGFQNDALVADFWIDELLVTPERVGCPEPG